MGYWKQVQLEQEEAGFSLGEPGRLVCPSCIADERLRLYVSRVARLGDARCDFCAGPGPHGLAVQELFRYMASMIGAEWGDPYHLAAWDQEDGRYVGVYPIHSDELLWELGKPLANDELRATFVEAFEHDWCPVAPYQLRPDDRLTHGWEAFARYVKEEARYLFLRTGRSRGAHPDPDEIEPAAMLEELQLSIVNSGVIKRLPAGSELFRARQHRREETLTTPGQLGSPPRAVAGARELAYLDLVDVDVPSLFDMPGRAQRPWRLFLRRFAEAVAQPVRPGPGGVDYVDYVPTQIVTEFVRHELLDGDGSPVRGIRYPSAARAGGVSWVLFVVADGCVEAAPGWEDKTSHWLGMDAASLRRFQPSWAEETR